MWLHRLPAIWVPSELLSAELAADMFRFYNPELHEWLTENCKDWELLWEEGGQLVSSEMIRIIMTVAFHDEKEFALFKLFWTGRPDGD